jgi:hypothetical protein
MKHQADVGTLSSRMCFTPYPTRYGWPLLFPPSYTRTPIGVPYGFAFRAILLREKYGVSVFRAFDEIEGLGPLFPPAGRRPCRES